MLAWLGKPFPTVQSDPTCHTIISTTNSNSNDQTLLIAIYMCSKRRLDQAAKSVSATRTISLRCSDIKSNNTRLQQYECLCSTIP